MVQTPYSLDMVPAVFFLFLKLNTVIKGKRFATIMEVKEKSKQDLLVLPNSVFQKYFENWKKCWHTCIKAERGYFEGNKIIINK